MLLTLLSLGVKGITLGPKPPAFISPNVFKILQEKFDLRLTGASAPGRPGRRDGRLTAGG